MGAQEISGAMPGAVLPAPSPAPRQATIIIPLSAPVLDDAGRWRTYSPAGADLTLLQSGSAPLLLDHHQTCEAVVGVIEGAWIVEGALIARARFATTPRGVQYAEMVEGRIIQHVSMAAMMTQQDEGRGGTLATYWRPYEISLTPLPRNWAARIEFGGMDPEIREAVAASVGASARASVLASQWLADAAAELLAEQSGTTVTLMRNALRKAIDAEANRASDSAVDAFRRRIA